MRLLAKHKVWLKRFLWLSFIIYIAAMAYFLFFSEQLNRDGGDYEYNLKLFQEIKRSIWCYQNGMQSYFYLNFVMNIVAFMPFGFILPALSPKNRKFLNILLLGFELTISIEIVQLLLKVGCFDVDDILLNTIGAALGYVLFGICHKLGVKHAK